MLFRIPFSDRTEWPTGRSILVGLLCAHIAWICVHLWLVSNKQINPWKLGGYGMYTTADPSPVIQVYDMRFGGQVMPPESIKIKSFVENNARLAFRCRRITEKSIKRLVADNPHLAGVPLQLAVLELRLKREPIRPEWGPSTIVGIRWLSRTNLVYAAKTCGEDYRGKILIDDGQS